RDVRGLDSFGAGLRLLPMIGGMVVGMVAGTRLQGAPGRPGMGAKALGATGFGLMAAARAAGAVPTVTTGTRLGGAGVGGGGAGRGVGGGGVGGGGGGVGLAMASAMNAALGALSAERSGAGSSLIQALRQVGATLGAAILGTVLSSAYQARLDVTGLPAAAADAAKSGVSGGVEAARSLGSASVLRSVEVAFVHGMDVMLWCCAGIA